MIEDRQPRPGGNEPDDAIELEDYHTDRAAEASLDERARPVHRDQHVEYTHELSEGTAEAVSRVLIRLVPLIYGGLLGHLGGQMALGLLLGFAFAAAFDLYMGDKSVLRTRGRRAAVTLCPRIEALARGLMGLIRRLGWRVPDFLRRLHCGV